MNSTGRIIKGNFLGNHAVTWQRKQSQYSLFIAHKPNNWKTVHHVDHCISVYYCTLNNDKSKFKKIASFIAHETAKDSISFVTRIAHAFGQRCLMLAGRIRIADVYVQARHLCVRLIIPFPFTGHRRSPSCAMKDMKETLKTGSKTIA